ncbi:MAG: HAD family hydrolase [Rhodospirillales bacterium]|nr:HAD family hydrolase [Alphaproteobacteria bacterium]USO04187.1 MAG: HAD family hydrolase [Rhodospirillales bacterium]
MKHIKAIIWDLDNTLYRFDEMFVRACNVAAARTICTLVDDFTFEEALVLAEKSYEQHGYSGYCFIEDKNVEYSDYHFPFHDAMDEKILGRNEDMCAGLEQLNLPQAIVTNASRGWAQRALSHLGLKEWFPDEVIFALEDADFQPKSRSTRPFELAREKLGQRAEDILVVEDSLRNLTVPKDMGFQTAFIHHGSNIKHIPDFVDYAFPDTVALLKELAA